MLEESYFFGYNPEYNIKTKGFYVKAGDHCDFPHKIRDNYIHFKVFPSSKTSNHTLSDGYPYKEEEIFIGLSEENAIKVETSPNNFTFLFLFKISGIEKVVCYNPFSNGFITIPTAQKLRILIYENNTKNVVYDKLFQ